MKGYLPLSMWGLSSEGVEQFGRSEALVSGLNYHLFLLNPMHEFDTSECPLGRVERFDPEPRPCHTFYCSMVLFHDVIELFDFTNCAARAVLRIIALDGRLIGRAPVDGDLLRHAVLADRLRQKTFRGRLIALLRQEAIDGLALLIHCTGEIPPLPFNLAIRLIHAPTDPDMPFAAMERLCEERTRLDDPSVDRRVINVHPTFLHAFLDMACAQRVRYRPADSHENNLWGEMGTFEIDRHRRSPS